MNRIFNISSHLISSNSVSSKYKSYSRSNLKMNDDDQITNIIPPIQSNLTDNTIQYQEFENGTIKIILNRNKALNSLLLDMLHELYRLLSLYENDHKVKLVIITALPGSKAFCSGGDIKQFVSTRDMGHIFAKIEYKLDYLIHTYPKPIISIVDGIVMGGGVGLSIHSEYRVMTEKVTWAMPENKIAYFPDVGTNFFTSRMGALGLYLVMTGTRVGLRDCVELKIASHFVESCNLERLVDDLCNDVVDQRRQIEFILNKWRKQVPVAPELPNRMNSHFQDGIRESVERCFGRDVNSVEEIIQLVEKESSTNPEWAKSTLTKLREACPVSVKITFQAVREALQMEIDQIFRMDLRIGTRITREQTNMQIGVHHALIDKVNQPKFDPPTIEMVDQAIVDSYFKEMDDSEELDI